MKSVLLAVCGLTPQIVTETLYLLHQENALPRRVVILTTRSGRELCRKTLFGAKGMLARFFADYGIASRACRVDEEDLLVPQLDGREVEDITSVEESAAFQDLCMRQALLLTRDADTRVEFSFAGGRKTMGACLALAAQCCGREQDRLFHVLVSPEFESLPGFFYPDPANRSENCDAVEAAPVRPIVTRAVLPFMRLRPYLPPDLLAQASPPERLFAGFSPFLTLVLEPKHRRVTVKHRSCVLPPVEFALLLWFALRKKAFACEGDCAACGQRCFVDVSEFLADTARLAELYEEVKVSSAAHGTTGILNLSAENFMAYKARLHRRLRHDLGDFAAGAEICSSGVRPYVRYGLRMPRDAVCIRRM